VVSAFGLVDGQPVVLRRLAVIYYSVMVPAPGARWLGRSLSGMDASHRFVRKN